MEIIDSPLEGVLVIKPEVWSDERGYFKEIFQLHRYFGVGVELPLVQDNFSKSTRGVLRGLHFQRNKPQGKLVSCLRGTIFDVVIDINQESSTFGEYFAIELSEDNHLQVWIPPGYAHGFCVVSSSAMVHYKTSDYYDPHDEGGIIWDDPELSISWPIKSPKLSPKDLRWPRLEEFLGNFK
ncbi:dTDP-4-dehydrorhamnose 3,5-epimerase [Litorivicinus sp.]|nr:dTDP-4-dehydrorhamnose 3,5-epimerase [Litorivicinus sp.]